MISIIQKCKEDFDKVIKYSQHIEKVDTLVLLERWYEAKKKIIQAWGGEPIIEFGEVALELEESEKRNRLNTFLEAIEYNYENEDLACFVRDIREDFFSNRLSHDYHMYDGTKIAKGTKIVKAFKYFEYNEKVLQELQTQASMIIQEDKVHGILCMSVHPLDYLSSSENTYNWRSCHALDGDYRGGNLSYMLDSSTIVCYLKRGCEMCKLPNFPSDVLWNSKKWRMLLFLEDNWDALFAGRQYPFVSKTALDHIQQFFFQAFNQSHSCWSRWYDDFITTFPRKGVYPHRDCNVYNGRAVMLNGRIYSMLDLVTDVKGSLHFDDLIYSSCYIPYYCWTYYPKGPNKPLHFTIGSKVPCVCCGTNIIGEMDDSVGTMMCRECEEQYAEDKEKYYTYCGCCGRQALRRLTVWVESIDDYVCEECCEKETQLCDRCETRWYTSDITYDRTTNEHICPYCKEGHSSSRLSYAISFDDGDLPF